MLCSSASAGCLWPENISFRTQMYFFAALFLMHAVLQGFGADYVELDHQKSGNSLYLLLQSKRVSQQRQEHTRHAKARILRSVHYCM